MTNRFLLFTAILFFVFARSQSVAQGVSINTTGSSPDNSSMLDISATNRGLLIPRVSLQSLSDQTTIASPATYLTVYNTNSSVGSGTGMYYWNGNSWNYMAAPSNGSGTNGQVLMSQGSGQAPQWNPIPPSGGGGSLCACYNNYQVFTSSGTFTIPQGTTLIKVQVLGAGGGGCGMPPNQGIGGGGGGGGGYAEGVYTVIPGTQYTVTVGTGGAAGAPGGNSGSQGGTSSFGNLISSTGGSGGFYNPTVGIGVGGQGGLGSSGYYNSTLGSGGSGAYSSTFAAENGANNGGTGSGLYGGGGGGGAGGGNGGSYNIAGNNALANTGAGGGGGGAGNNLVAGGGNGADGEIVVYW